jgi:ABC-type antimicrobial peptide transport system ATPase subunit
MSDDERAAFISGAKAAADVARSYNSVTAHPYRLDDCILWKLNIGRKKPRKNDTHRIMVSGWVILHPNGQVETDYFHSRRWWWGEGKYVSRETWRKTFRPDCRMVRATLTWTKPMQGPSHD